jgi:hypothetical protein
MKCAPMLAAALAGLIVAGSAAADDAAVSSDRSAERSPGPGLPRAFELAVSMGYLQPTGNLSANTPIGDIAGVGVVAGVDVGVRITPHWAVLAGGQYHFSDGPAASSARGFAAQIGAAYHVWPNRFPDAYFALRSGYRLLWQVTPNASDDALLHGFDVARLELGIDYRISKSFAIGPVLTGDFNVFAWRVPDSGPSTSIDNERVSLFVAASLVGRFDLGAAKETPRAAPGDGAPMIAAR